MILRFAAVTVARGGRVLAENLSFALAAGDAALVTGPNGVGKSSLLRVAAGLARPLAGEVAAGRCALMAEQVALDGERTLRAALHFWARLDGAGDDASDRVEDALAAVDLAALRDVPVRMLSTGQRRRAALARVVASAAPLWLLDEPANGLDTASVARLEALVAAHRAGGGAVVIATHLPLAVPDAQLIVLGAGPDSSAGAGA